MKTIQVSDEDYETLMELSKELQQQENQSQAFPYFWEPSSKKIVINPHDEGEFLQLLIDGQSVDPDSVAEYDDFEKYNRFLEENHDDHEMGVYHQELESDWIEYVEESMDEATTMSYDKEYQEDHNPTLFLSDAQSYIRQNRHHLSEEPRTYARTIWRMPKMQELVGAIYRINKDHGEEINHEAKRIVDGGTINGGS